MCRTSSGITQITVLSSPYPNDEEFSCEHNCYYCPNEPAHEGNNFTPNQDHIFITNRQYAEQMKMDLMELIKCGIGCLHYFFVV